jgi:predicted Zn-dependent protease
MAAVYVDLGSIGSKWPTACRTAVAHLNQLFTQNSIGVSLALIGKGDPRIAVRTDPSIKGTLHGHTQTRTISGQLLSAVVSLPVKATINTPQGVREAGAGVLEVIVAHEFVHALGQVQHTNSHLMYSPMSPVPGDSPAGDILQGNGVNLPPLALAPDTVDLLQSLWP